jgi:hypothetical protein
MQCNRHNHYYILSARKIPYSRAIFARVFTEFSRLVVIAGSERSEQDPQSPRPEYLLGRMGLSANK